MTHSFKVYRKRFLLPDKLLGEGYIREGDKGECKIKIQYPQGVFIEEYSMVNTVLRDNPQTLTRLKEIAQCEFKGNGIYIVFGTEL